MKILRIATRRSLLARIQAQAVGRAVHASCGRPFELVEIVTGGDRLTGPLQDAGGKGLFTVELDLALRRGDADLAVHSAKDVPVPIGEEFTIAAVPKREDARDALVSRWGGLEALPAGAVIGTSSHRRSRQITALRNDVRIVPIRGNVDTRLRKTMEGQDGLDASILAMAGLHRLGLIEQFGPAVFPFAMEQIVPAAGQGALLVQCMSGRPEVAKMLSAIDDADSRQALLAERWVVGALSADCHSCLGVHLCRAGDIWRAWGMVGGSAHGDGGGVFRTMQQDKSADQAAKKLLDVLLNVSTFDRL